LVEFVEGGPASFGGEGVVGAASSGPRPGAAPALRVGACLPALGARLRSRWVLARFCRRCGVEVEDLLPGVVALADTDRMPIFGGLHLPFF
jgi:hypothetical protein